MFLRDFEDVLLKYTKFPVIGILGPRQSGKTTLSKKVFKSYTYVSFEDPDIRNLAKEDPRQFLRIYENSYGIIIDEFQYVPEILSYIQLDVDEKQRPGYFILTGSQNFLMNTAITQSLAGRIGILTLLPLSIHELKENAILAHTTENAIYDGGYPRIFDQHIAPDKFYPSYIQSYIERDVRSLVNVGDLMTFDKFLRLCAGRIGQQVNFVELGAVCGISNVTAQRWLSILQASYVIFLLPPHFNNYNKRLTKSPKLYFYDTGLACSLLNIDSPESLAHNSFKGSLFECFIVADIYKQYFNIGKKPPVYYWRDLNGRLEIDCIIEQSQELYPIEIKSGETVASNFFDGIETWNEMASRPLGSGYVVYGGDLVQERSKGHVIGWKAAGTLVEQLRKKLP